MKKDEIRRIMKEKLLSQSSTELSKRSEAITLKLLQQTADAKRIFCYLPLPGEVDTRKLINTFIESGREVYSPVIDGDVIRAVRLRSVLDVKPGKFRIPEPTGTEESFTFDIIIVPGVAFDKNCIRLGRGKGYFDKFLAKSGEIKIGLAFDFQIVDVIEAENHDIAVDEVVTENRTIQRLD